MFPGRRSTWARLAACARARSVLSTRPSSLSTANQRCAAKSQERSVTGPGLTWAPMRSSRMTAQEPGHHRAALPAGPSPNTIAHLAHLHLVQVPARRGSRVVVPDVNPPHWAQTVRCAVVSTPESSLCSASLQLAAFLYTYLSMKVSREFLLNRVHPGACSSFVCDAPSSPYSTMYTW